MLNRKVTMKLKSRNPTVIILDDNKMQKILWCSEIGLYIVLDIIPASPNKFEFSHINIRIY